MMAQRIVDLSLLIEDNMLTHKLFQSPIITTHTTHEQSASIGLGEPGDLFTYQTNVISTLDHVGTHVDAPVHFDPNGASVDQLPLEGFMGKAVCFDFTHIPDLGDIDVRDMEEAQEKAAVKVEGHIVLMNTGLHKRHYPNRSVTTSNPGLTAAATHWLADRDSKYHGIEGPSTDAPNNPAFPSHRVCRDRGIAHFEWLVNLEELVGKGEFMFYGVPLKIKGASGSPVRAFAVLLE
jgi:kynurenine formamidase